MAISIIGTVQTGVANNGGEVTLTWDVRPSEGDVTFVVIASPAATPNACTVNATYNYGTALKAYTGTGFTYSSMAIFAKVQGVTTDTDVKVTADGASTTDTTAIGIVLRGVDTSNILDTAVVEVENAAGSPTAPAITTVTDGAWVLIMANDGPSADISPGTVSGYSNQANVSGNDTYDNTLAFGTKLIASHTTETPTAWSTWAVTHFHAFTVAVRKAIVITTKDNNVKANIITRGITNNNSSKAQIILRQTDNNSAKADIISTSVVNVSSKSALGDKIYTREQSASLAADSTNLLTAFTSSEVSDVDSDNTVRVNQTASGAYAVFLFKKKNSNNTDQITISWDGQSDVAPSTYPIYLQIYNFNTPGWENLDSDSTTNTPNTDITLSGSKTTNLTNYYSNNWVVARVYQQSA